MNRIAAVQTFFTGGKRRDYLILHQAGHANAASRRAPKSSVRSLADVVKPDALDLRDRRYAVKLDAALLRAIE
jgi:hypothetical protein